MEWTNEICLKLIDEYRSHPSLWDQTSLFYKNKLKRKEAWAMLAERFNCTKAEVERKMNVLLTQYRREKHKILLQSYKDGGEIRKTSRWYAFKKFSFMDSSLIPKKCALQLYGAMQMRLGFPGLQSSSTSSSVLPNLLWNSASENSNCKTNELKVPNLTNGIINHNKNLTNDYNEPVQDLSMNSSSSQQQKSHQQQTQQHHNHNQLQSNNTMNEIIHRGSIDDLQQDDNNEIMEIHVDPKNIEDNNNRILTKNLNLSPLSTVANKYLSTTTTSAQNIFYPSTEIKDEIVDEISSNNYNGHEYDDDDDDDDEDADNSYDNQRLIGNDYSKNYINNQNKLNSRTKSLLQHHKRFNKKFNEKSSTITSYKHLPATIIPNYALASRQSVNNLQTIAEQIINENNNKDDCDYIGCNIAMKLRTMQESQRIIAEKLISDVIFYGQLKELDKTATIYPNSSIPQIATAHTSGDNS